MTKHFQKSTGCSYKEALKEVSETRKKLKNKRNK